MRASASIVGSDKWSPHLKQLLEEGWLLLRAKLDQRKADDACFIFEGGGVGFAPRSVLLQIPAFAQLYSLHADDVPSDHVRVVVRARDGETGACRIPLASVQVGEVPRG